MKMSIISKLKEKLKDKRGVGDLISLASAIIATVVVCIIGVYITSKIYEQTELSTSSPFQTAMQGAVSIMNSTFPLLVVVIVALVAGVVMTYILGGFGAAGGGKR